MNVAGTIENVRTRIRRVERRQWVIGGLSVLITAGIFFAFLVESRFGYLARDPIVAYFKSWQDGRSRAEALADQEEEQRLAAEADAIAASLDIGADNKAAAEAVPEMVPMPGTDDSERKAASAE